MQDEETTTPEENDPEPTEGETTADSPGEEAVPAGPEDGTALDESGGEAAVPEGASPPAGSPEDRRPTAATIISGTSARKAFEEPFTSAGGSSEGETMVTGPPGPEADDTRVSKLVVQSGLASENDMTACMQALDQVRSVGVSRTLIDVMLDRGVLTSNQAMAVRAASEAGDEAGLLGGYQLLDKLGEGGMGEVYKAKQLSLDRLVALKVLPDRLARNREFTARFEREAKIAAKLDHQNVVRAIDVGVAAGKHYFVMEYVEGRTVGEVLDEKGKIPEKDALDIIIQVTRALECAWRNKLVHRDVKPDNILLAPNKVAKLADLGLARELVTSEDTRITQTGAVMGTPQYVSPEQATGSDVDIRTDIYSLGATFYHMLVGRPPFEGKNLMEMISARFQGRFTPVKQAAPEVSLGAAGVIARMMARDLEHRYPDPRVLLRDLLLVASGRKPEFASASESARMRAIEAAKSMDTDTTLFYVGPRRMWLRIALAGVGAAAALVAIMGALSLLGGAEKDEARPQPPAAVTPPPPPRPSAEQVQAACDEVRGAIDAGEFEEAVKLAVTYAAKLAGGPGVEKLDELRLEASRGLDERLRREAEEKERERKYQSLVSEARRELASENFLGALTFLTQAKAVKETEEVDKLIEEARRGQFVARGKEAERRGALREAIGLYQKALAIEEDAELRARVEELERRARLAELSDEGDALRAEERWREARDKYEEALGYALNQERKPIEEKIAECEREMSFLGALDGGDEAAAAEEWEKALELADKALTMKPENARALDLRARAKKALGPDKLVTDSVGIDLVLVPEGEFPMGSDDGQEDEAPRHMVYVSSFYISKHEVTNAQFALYNPSHRQKWETISPADDMPVVCAAWEQANAFCAWLSRQENARYRLPTEAEWEKAARGADGRLFPWGVSSPDEGGHRCNYAPVPRDAASRGKDGFQLVSPVGSFPKGASPFEVLDMAGNVWEWCLDRYAGDYYASSPERDPRGPEAGETRVLRGGSFANSARTLRCSNRRSVGLGFFEGNVGFRVAREVESQ